MKIYVVKKGSIMSDDNHKVKEFLLEWLFMFGSSPVKRNFIWNLDNGYRDMEPYVKLCIRQGYISQIRSRDDGRFSHALTDEGLNFLNKGEKHEQ